MKRSPGNSRAVTRMFSFVVSVMLLSTCNGSGGPGGAWDVPELDRKIILPWLLCTDCIEGELDKVVNRGDRLVPYLSAAVLDGPTQAEDSLARMRALEATLRVIRYRQKRLQTMAQLTPAESTAMISSQHDAFTLKYRLRAAQALQRLDSVAASRSVIRFCQHDPPELQRNPHYKASFKSIGACP